MKAPIDRNERQYYIFVVNGVEWEPFTDALTIVTTLTARSVWLVSEFTPFRKIFKRGDRVLFYLAGSKSTRCFVGNSVIAGPTEEATEADLAVAKKLGLNGFAERIALQGISLWETRVFLKPIVEELDFIKDKQNYGLHFRQGATRIGRADYDRILLLAKQTDSEIDDP